MMIAYIVFLHLCLAVLVARPLIRRLQRFRSRSPAASRVYRYEDILRVHQRIDAAVPEGAVLCFGDSFTAGMCTLALSEKAVNFGIGRDTVDDVRRRLRRYGSLQRCGGIVLAVGFNDLMSRTPYQVAESYSLLLEELPDDVPVILCGVPPVDPQRRAKPANSQIAELNRQLAELAEREARLHYILPPEELMDDAAALRPDVHEGDGVHLNGRGYAIWTAAISERLAGPAAAPESSRRR